jgi:hypothetical protein
MSLMGSGSAKQRKSCVVSWDREFYEPVAVPGKRQPLTTIREAALYITSLPDRGAEHWRPAATLLRLVGENGGCRRRHSGRSRRGQRPRKI